MILKRAFETLSEHSFLGDSRAALLDAKVCLGKLREVLKELTSLSIMMLKFISLQFDWSSRPNKH